jgi:hypothetical protein
VAPRSGETPAVVVGSPDAASTTAPGRFALSRVAGSPGLGFASPEDDEREEALARREPHRGRPLRAHPVDAPPSPGLPSPHGHPPDLHRHLHHGQRPERDALHGDDGQPLRPGLAAQNHIFKGFTDRHGCTNLYWFERHVWVTAAIRREKRIQKWLRDWKLKLIEDANPDWLDLAADWYPVNDPDWTPPEEPD